MARTATKGRRTAKAKQAEPEETEAKGNGRRTHEDILELVPEIVEKLKDGVTMTEIRAEYGAGPVIRKALTEKGYNTKGERIEVEEIEGKGATLAKRVAAKREDGWAWYKLEIATDMSTDDLKELLEEHGYGELAEGRVVLAKDEEDDEEEEAKPARKRGRTKAAASNGEDKPAARKRGRRKAANPSKVED